MDQTRGTTRRPYQPLSPLSAAQPLLAWIDAHNGAWPKWRQCCSSQGLLQGQTYYRYFQASTFSQVIERAQAVLDGTPMTSWLAILPRVSRTKPCLGDCGVTILDEGAHVRFCAKCRWKQLHGQMGLSDEGALEPVLTLPQRRHLGLQQGTWDDWDLMEL